MCVCVKDSHKGNPKEGNKRNTWSNLCVKGRREAIESGGTKKSYGMGLVGRLDVK